MSNTALTKKGNTNLPSSLIESGMVMHIQDFTERLNQDVPPDALIKTYEKKDAIAISHVEMMLDEIFFGHWSLDEINYQREFNEIVGSGVLTVRHPVTGKMIRRAGFGSIVITQAKGTPVMDFQAHKQANALDLAFPKLKAKILKNAAKTLGKCFGRDLNRTVEDEYTPEIVVVPPTELTDEQRAEFSELLQSPAYTEERRAKAWEIITADGYKKEQADKLLIAVRKEVANYIPVTPTEEI